MTGGDEPVDRETAFVTLFDAHYGKILAYATRRLGPDAATEVVADTFVTAWLKLDNLRGDPLLWLYGLARGTVANHRRRAVRAQRLGTRAGQLTVPVDRGDPADEVVWRDSFEAAFAQLGESDREVLRLVAWEGLDPAGGATVLGCSTGAFKVRLHRARRRLRSYLALDVGTTRTPVRRTVVFRTDELERPQRPAGIAEEFPCP